MMNGDAKTKAVLFLGVCGGAFLLYLAVVGITSGTLQGRSGSPVFTPDHDPLVFWIFESVYFLLGVVMFTYCVCKLFGWFPRFTVAFDAWDKKRRRAK
jgi:hypothetical protein